ncbi:MAG: hypothetical protein ACM3S3_10915 [Candidatus Doudnabacteria bacterium]
MSLQAPEPVSLEVSDGPAPLRPPPEAELVEAGKLTMGQLAQAHRDRLETGKPVLDIIVERGWILAQEAARLRETYGIEAPPVPTVQPAPEPPLETQAPPPPATQERYKIAIRLTNGDLITAGETDGADKAAALGHAVVADLTQENGEWPFFGGRFINPETIVSVDLLTDV